MVCLRECRRVRAGPLFCTRVVRDSANSEDFFPFAFFRMAKQSRFPGENASRASDFFRANRDEKIALRHENGCCKISKWRGKSTIDSELVDFGFRKKSLFSLSNARFRETGAR